MIRIGRLTGIALARAPDDLARLRIAVFRDWTYLYDGDPGYEARYLQAYRDSADAILVAAWDGRIASPEMFSKIMPLHH